jgi:hypothetical protein
MLHWSIKTMAASAQVLKIDYPQYAENDQYKSGIEGIKRCH